MCTPSALENSPSIKLVELIMLENNLANKELFEKSVKPIIHLGLPIQQQEKREAILGGKVSRETAWPFPLKKILSKVL